MAMFTTANPEVEISNRDKIKYLKRYINLDREIERKLEEVARLRSKLTRVTEVFTAEPKGGGSIRGKTENIIAKIVDLEKEIDADIDQLVAIRDEIKAVIESVEDDRERLLLQYRYLDGKTFEWIAAKMDLTDDLLKQEENKAVCAVCEAWLEKHVPAWDEEVSQDDRCSEKEMLPACDRLLGQDRYQNMLKDVYAARQTIQQRTAWRIDGTLREFPKFKPVNLWFTYPTHQVDVDGLLKDQEAEADKAPWQRNFSKKRSPADLKKDRKKSIEIAYEACSFDEKVTVKSMAEYMGKSEDTVRRHLKEHGGFWIDNGDVGKK